MTTEATDNATQIYDVRRRCGGLFRHSVEMTLPDGTMAIFAAGVFRSTGTITISDTTYQVKRASMSDESGNVAEYSICHRFMRLTIARLTDLVRSKRYVLHQQRCWSSNLVMLEDDVEVGMFKSDLFQSRYRVSVNQDISTHAVLLCVWIAMIRGAFTA